MANPSTVVLQRMLEPWLSRARTRLDLSLDTFAQASDITRDLWIQWHMDATIAIEDVEALELLELFARVDCPAAWTAILDVKGCSVHLPTLVDAASADSPVYPRYALCNLENLFAASSERFQQLTAWLLFSIDPMDHSPMYYAVRQTLLQCIVDQHSTSLQQPHRRIAIMFDFDLSPLRGSKLADALLNQVAKTVAIARDVTRMDILSASPPQNPARQSSAVTLSDVFELTCMEAALNDLSATDALLRTVQAIHTNGKIPMSAIRLGRARFAPHKLSPVATTAFLRAMLLRTDASTDSPTALDLVDCVGIGVFQATLSALMCSRSVRCVSLSLPDLTAVEGRGADYRVFWSWIAYALFSRQASHAIERLDLGVFGLTVAHVEAFTDVLSASDPLAGVGVHPEAPYESSDSSERQTRVPMVVDVCPNATLLLTTDGMITEIPIGDETATLRVVEDAPDRHRGHVCVVYPGAGICWVARSQIIAMRRSVSRAPRARPSIQRLDLQLDGQTSLNALLCMLQFIGSELHTLTVTGNRTGQVRLSHTWMLELLRACPRLQRLDLVRVELSNLRWLLMEDSVHCGLRALSLRHVDLLQVKGYQSFLEALASTRTLCRLAELHIQCDTHELDAIFPSLVRVLDSNRTLERVLLSSAKIKPRYQTALAARNGVPLSIQTKPLRLKHKLAFLSCVTQPSVKAESSRTTRGWELDAAVVGIIFAFAAPHKLRVCGFTN